MRGPHLRRSRAECDAHYLKTTGYTLDEFRAVPKDARKKFQMHRVNAKYRGVEWQFRLREWWEIWLASGKWELRGKGGYVMCRKGDLGPYAADNVFIAHTRVNTSEVRKKKSGLPRGVAHRDGRFYAYCTVAGQRMGLGGYSTAAEAHSAYLRATGYGQ
jgi:hypothetical protein